MEGLSTCQLLIKAKAAWNSTLACRRIQAARPCELWLEEMFLGEGLFER